MVPLGAFTIATRLNINLAYLLVPYVGAILLYYNVAKLVDELSKLLLTNCTSSLVVVKGRRHLYSIRKQDDIGQCRTEEL